MPITYHPVTQAELEETAHTLLKCGERLTIALQMLKQENLETVWLPWTAATRRSLDMVKFLGSQAVVEAEDQVDSVRRNRPNRHEVQHRKSRYEADRRTRQTKSRESLPRDIDDPGFPDGSTSGSGSAPAATPSAAAATEGTSGSGQGSVESTAAKRVKRPGKGEK